MQHIINISNNMDIRISILLFITLAHFFTLNGQTEMECYLADPKAGIRPNNIDIKHLLVDLSFVPEQGLVKGSVILSFTPLQKEVDTFLTGKSLTDSFSSMSRIWRIQR